MQITGKYNGIVEVNAIQQDWIDCIGFRVETVSSSAEGGDVWVGWCPDQVARLPVDSNDIMIVRETRCPRAQILPETICPCNIKHNREDNFLAGSR